MQPQGQFATRLLWLYMLMERDSWQEATKLNLHALSETTAACSTDDRRSATMPTTRLSHCKPDLRLGQDRQPAVLEPTCSFSSSLICTSDAGWLLQGASLLKLLMKMGRCPPRPALLACQPAITFCRCLSCAHCIRRTKCGSVGSSASGTAAVAAAAGDIRMRIELPQCHGLPLTGMQLLPCQANSTVMISSHSVRVCWKKGISRNKADKLA